MRGTAKRAGAKDVFVSVCVCVFSLAAAVTCFSLLQMINQAALLLDTADPHTRSCKHG